ncbi:hypothetical protein G6F56_002690 [Rhizopus delemar]|uniref:Uncharacterized protein n=1 Tax=Rhizopus stolonifer TaxID=4846 RepID=A0A367J9H8_RHIST|nr:hypothetical protein G6F56_002690 [Rhizopus delemar]RCH86614.1 hypothetical protein CU098_007639 [Rhizopus stolonifer]
MVSLNYVLGFIALAPLFVQAQPTRTSSAPLAKRSPHSCFGSGQWGYVRDVVSACSSARIDFSNEAISKSHSSQRSYGPYSTNSGNRAYVDIRVENNYGSQYEYVTTNDIAFACNEITQLCVGNNRDTRGGWSIQGPFKIYVDVNNCGC